MSTYQKVVLFIFASAWGTCVTAQTVVNTIPEPNATNVARSAQISAVLDSQIDFTSVDTNSFAVTGSITGYYRGSYAYDQATKTILLTPDRQFENGEVLTVTLSNAIHTNVGDPLKPHTWRFTVAVGSGTGVFFARTSERVGSLPIGITAGDWNGDGLTDLAVVSEDVDSLTVLANDGDGNFRRIFRTRIGDRPFQVISGDFDHDGDLDLVAAFARGSSITIYYNDGAGNFSQRSSFGAGSVPISVTSGDFDSDGDEDLAVASITQDKISILLNNGDGWFNKSFETAVGDEPRFITAGDFDNDGNLDLAVTHLTSKNVYVLRNNGDATFDRLAALWTQWSCYGITPIDIDLDGDLDLATTLSAYTKVKLFENDGSGGFTALADLEVGGGPRYVVAGDFNNDSYLDLAVSVRGPDDVVILENNQNGTFFRTQIIKTWPDPIPLTAGDLDNDGDIDLAFGKYKTPGEIGILENRSAVQEIGLSSPELSFGIIRSNSTTQQAIVLRNDGLSGVLEVNEIRFSTNNWTSDRSTLSLQPMQVGTMHITFAPSGPGLFEDHLALTSNDPLHPEMTVSLSGAAAPLVIAASPEPSRPAGHFVTAISATFNSAMQATTIDAQSYRVFGALSGRKEGRISYDPSLRKARFDLDDQFVFGEDVQVMLDPSLLNTPENLPLLEGHSWHFTTHTLFGTGHFMRAAADLATGQGVFGIAAGEFNHDGFPDIVVTNSDDNSITVFLNDGNQGFEADSTYVVGTNPQGVVVADVTNDGFTDILCTNSGSNSVFFLENQQNAAFRLRNLQQVGVFPRAIAAADLNNDGEIDYVTANVSANTVSIMIRRPPLLNFDRTDVPVGEAPSGLALKDLDNDGRIDIVASNRISGDIVILSREAGVFVPDTTIVVGGTPEGIVARDFDADRFVDLAVVDGSGDRIVILRNSGNARFSVVAELPTGDQPVAIYSNDFNVDGAFDLAVADFASKNVFIYHNDGSGTFNQADTTHIVDNPRSITGLDISGIAGAIDLVATQFNNDKVVILKNEIINQAPVLAAKLDDAVFPEDSGAHVLTSDLRAFFSDPDQHELLFAARSVQPGIVAQIQDSVQLVVRTELNFFGRGQIIVTATDRVATISDTIEVTVPPVNDAPVIAPIPPISFNEDDTTTVSLDTFIRDVDNDTSEIQWRFMVLLDSLNTAALPHSDEVLSPAKANRARLSDSARSTNSVNENEFFWVQNARQAVLFRQVALDSSAVLSIVIDSTSHVATFWAAPDFHADDIPVVFIATDLGGLTGVDTTTVSVLPVNDAPNAFALLSPADSSLVDSTVIVFTWHNTIDTDGDPLLYLWHLSGPDRSIYAGTVDTFFVFHGAAYLQSSETYTWFVEATDRSDTTRTAMSVFHTSVLTSVDATPEGSLPEAFVLFQNYPNPFNPSTSIKYGLPVLSKVRLSVYNLRGREVVRLIYGEQQAGYHSVVWDGRNQAGVAVASGIYIYRLVVEDASISYRRSVMMKRAVFIK